MKPTPKPSISALARKHGTSRETLRAWRDSGVDIFNAKSVAAKLSAMRGKSGSPITEARLAKILAETERITLALEIERGKYVSADLIYQDGRNIGKLTRDTLQKAADDLPPMLAGRSATEISPILKRYFKDMSTTLSKYKSAVKI